MRKGSSLYGADALGKRFNKLTGDEKDPTKTLSWLDEPPDTNPVSPDDQDDHSVENSDMLHGIAQYFGDLLKGITNKGVPGKGTATELPKPKTPQEANDLKPGTKYLRPDGKVMVR